MTLAKPHSENGVTLYLLPRLNMRFYRVKDEVEKVYPPSSNLAAISIDRFATLEALSLAPFCEAPADNPFTVYFEQRNGKTVLERFELFETLMDIDEINVIYNAYTANREPVLPLELPADIVNDEQAKKNGSSSGLETKPNANGNLNSETKSATLSKPMVTEPAS